MQTSLKTLWQKIRIFIGKLGETLRRAPAEIFTTVYAFVTFTLAYEKVSPIQEEYIALAPLIFVLSFILNRLCRGKWRLIYYLSPLVYVLFIKTDLKDWITSTEYIIALLICPLAVILSDWIKENKRFAERIIRYLVDWVAAGLLALVAYLLVNAIVYSFGYIFDLHIPSKFSFYAFLSASILLTPLCFLTFNRQSEQTPDRPIPGNSFLDILARYVLTPAAWIYTIILYLYFVRIAITWSLPRGGIAYLVFGFILFATILKALQPLLQKQPCKWFYERFSLISLPALIMFWIGVGYRINQYGLTEDRIYLIVCGVVMTLTIGLFFSHRWGRYLYATLSAVVLLALVTYIPGIRAGQLGLLSQNLRAERLIDRLQLADATGKIAPIKRPDSDSIHKKDYRDLYNTLSYLEEHDKSESLKERYGIAGSHSFQTEIVPRTLEQYVAGWWCNNDTIMGEELSSVHLSIDDSSDKIISIEGYKRLHYYVNCWDQCGDTLTILFLDTKKRWDINLNEMLDRQLAGTPYVRTDTIPEQWIREESDRFLHYDVDSIRVNFSFITLGRSPQLSVDNIGVDFLLFR